MESLLEGDTQPILKLNGVSNFKAWKVQCESSLKLSGLWELVEGTEVEAMEDAVKEDGDFNAEKDRFRMRNEQARVVIFDSCEASIRKEHLWDFLSAQECWEVLIDSYECPSLEKERLDKWYDALYRTNCKELMKLLEYDESLVEVGWEGEPSRFPEPGTAWMGRTALHAGAIAGCVELVKLVSNLYRVKLSNKAPGGTQQDGATKSSRSTVGTTPGPSHMGKTERLTSRNSFTKIKGNLRKTNSSPGLSHIGRTERLTSRKSFTKIKGDLRKTNSSAARTSYINGSDDTTPGPGQIERTRPKSLIDLLAAVDGFSGLRAIAMAMQHGNRELIHALLQAEGNCEPSYPSFFGDEEELEKAARGLYKPKESAEYAEEEANKRGLRMVIKDYLKSIGSVRRSVIRKAYSSDTNFNFLPMEEYLFHFVCQDPALLDIIIPSEVHCPSVLWARIRDYRCDLSPVALRCGIPRRERETSVSPCNRPRVFRSGHVFGCF
jgi:hypothetical protein